MPCVVLTLKCEYSTGQGFSVLAFFCVVASSQIFPQVVKHLFFEAAKVGIICNMANTEGLKTLKACVITFYFSEILLQIVALFFYHAYLG